MKKIQILFIHGGMTFKNKGDYLDFLKGMEVNLDKVVKWQDEYLDRKLGKGFEVIRPKMPLKENAKYEEWKILFEKYLALLDRQYILIGNSLGGIFLAKYLSENKLKSKAMAVFMICPPFDNSSGVEDLVGGFRLGKDLSLIESNAQAVHLMFSQDDKVVPIVHAEKYKKKLPKANFHIYESKNGHFKIAEFPEIVRMIRSLR